MKQLKTAWEIICAFFRSESALADEYLAQAYKSEQDRYSLWATVEQVKDAENVVVLTPATRRRYEGRRSVRKFKLDKKGK